MSSEKIRTTVHSRSRQKTKTRSKAKHKRMDMLHLQQQIFERSPADLDEVISELLEDEQFDEYEDAEEDVVNSDELVELDSDADIVDEDMESTDDLPVAPISTYEDLLDDSTEFRDHPTLMLGTKYIIVVMHDADGKMICRFESPFDSFGRLPKKAGQVFIPKLVGFIEAVAVWLQDQKQVFLQNPSPENFVKDETARSKEPIVVQKWFLSHLNKNIPTTRQISLPNFSRLLNNIWIVWPRLNMPLKSIFSPAFKKAWLVEVCTAIYENAHEIWRQQLNNPKFTKKDIQAIKNRSFESLNPDEKLHLLRDILKIQTYSAKIIWHDSVERLTKDSNGKEERQ